MNLLYILLKVKGIVLWIVEATILNSEMAVFLSIQTRG